MLNSDKGLTGAYRCQRESGWARYASLGMTVGILLGLVLVSSVVAAAQKCHGNACSMDYSAKCAVNASEDTPSSYNLHNELKLTADQAGQLDAIRKDFKSESSAIRSRMTPLQAKLRKLLASENVNGAEARVLAERLSELQSKLQVAALDAHIKAQSVLTPAQRQKVVEFAGKKDTNHYALMNDKELNSALANLLCQSGECPTSVAGKTAPAAPVIRKEAKAVDPVCRMRINTAGAAYIEYGGTTYYFCNPNCKETFAANPKKYHN